MDFTSYDGAQHRVPRLQKALRIATAIMGVTTEQARILIRGLKDDRGTLVVSWAATPHPHQTNAFAVAWEQCGEHQASVSHIVVG